MTRAILCLLLLAACSTEPGDEMPDAASPDADLFCNPFREECGYCGKAGAECCFDPEQRPANYCIDGSSCVSSQVCVAPPEDD